LIGQLVEVVRGDDDFPDRLFGLFTKSIAALWSAAFMAAMSVATRSASVALDFFIGILLVDMTAIAQQALGALGNCFFCSGQTF
jgi:hypothetical protein